MPRVAIRALPHAVLAFAAALLLGCAREEASTAVASADEIEKVSARLLLFGVDGATWRVMDPLLAAEKLPNFARLIEAGTRAPLETLRPTHSPPIWTTIATGVMPEVHGIDSFVVRDPKSGERTLPSSNQRRVPALWNILSGLGYRVGVVNWWATFPAEEVEGFVISDRANPVRKRSYQSTLELTDHALLEHDPRATHPEALYAEIRGFLESATEVDPERVARFATLSEEQLAELRAQEVYERGNPLSVLKFTLLQDGSSTEAALHALHEHRPDFMAFFISGIDAIEHYFWKYMEPEHFPDVTDAERAAFGRVIERYYVYVDEILGRFLAEYREGGPFSVVVVSDHGQSPDLTHGTDAATGASVYASGNHADAEPGILILSGAHVAGGARLEASTVRDVAPTVLALLGAPVGRDMPGRVIEEALTREFLARHPVESIPTYAPMQADGSAQPIRSAGDQALVEKLRALGYVE